MMRTNGTAAVGQARFTPTAVRNSSKGANTRTGQMATSTQATLLNSSPKAAAQQTKAGTQLKTGYKKFK